MLNTVTGQIESEFHKFIRPTRFPTLSDYCKNLTGITQSLINQQDTFPTVFREFSNWLNTITVTKGLKFITRFDRVGKNAAFCSWSSWDFKEFLARDCRNHSLVLPEHLKVWIDIRKVFKVNNIFANLITFNECDTIEISKIQILIPIRINTTLR